MKTRKSKIVILLFSLIVSGWLTMQIFAQSVAIQNRDAVTLWVATKNINVGDTVTAADIQQVVFYGKGLHGLSTEKNILVGSVALVNVPADTPISSNMVESGGLKGSDERVYFTGITNEAGLSPGDRVDIILLGARGISALAGDDDVVVENVRIKSVTPKVSLVVTVQTARALARMERDGHLVLLKRQ